MADNEYPALIPPGGGGGAPLGPGAMVANSLQQILAQRRAESQQDMVNKLAQQKQAADITHLQNEDAYNKDAREALADSRKQTAALATSKQAHLKSLSDFASSQYPADPIESSMWRVIENDPERGEQLFQTIMAKRLAEQENTGPITEFDEPSNKFITPIDPATGKPRMGKKGEVVKRGYPPNPPQPNATNGLQQWYNTEPDPNDPTGKTMRQVPYMMTPQDWKVFLDKYKAEHGGGATVRKGNLPTTPVKPTPLFDKTRLGGLAATYGTPKFKEALNTFLVTVSDQHMKDDVRSILSDKNAANLPTSEVMKRVSPPDGLSPEEGQAYLDRVADLLSVVRQK